MLGIKGMEVHLKNHCVGGEKIQLRWGNSIFCAVFLSKMTKKEICLFTGSLKIRKQTNGHSKIRVGELWSWCNETSQSSLSVLLLPLPPSGLRECQLQWMITGKASHGAWNTDVRELSSLTRKQGKQEVPGPISWTPKDLGVEV